MIALKPHGQRFAATLWTELYLTYPPSKIPNWLNGRYDARKQKSAEFHIDAEDVKVYMNISWILAFDIPLLEANIALDGKKFKDWDLQLWDSIPFLAGATWAFDLPCKEPESAGSLCQIIKASAGSFQIHANLDTLPCKTHGLIFTPMRGGLVFISKKNDIKLLALKWKQPTKLTLDIVIGGPIKRSSLTTHFIVYLAAEVTGARPVLVAAASRVVPPSHLLWGWSYFSHK